MTDTTIRQRRNWHKASTGILIAIVVLAALGGTASHFLKPTGYVAFQPLSFGMDRLASAMPINVTQNPDTSKPVKPKAMAAVAPLPAEKPRIPPTPAQVR
jgi:hypothetical protein